MRDNPSTLRQSGNKRPSLPLEGVRVVAITQAWAGPYAGTLLADWGAEVIQVESRKRFPVGTRGLSVDHRGVVPVGERMWSRAYPDWDGGERPWNRYVGFNALNRNKLGVTLDESREEGRNLLLELISISDVVLENHPPYVLDYYSLTTLTFARSNPIW